MPTFQFEAMDATGQEIRDEIDAETEDDAQTQIREMGYFVTKINVKKGRKSAGKKADEGKKRSFAVGNVKSKDSRHSLGNCRSFKTLECLSCGA